MVEDVKDYREQAARSFSKEETHILVVHQSSEGCEVVLGAGLLTGQYHS